MIEHIEFLVDKVFIDKNNFHIHGACNLGPIKRGDVFTSAFQRDTKKVGKGYIFSKPQNLVVVQLSIESIVAYRTELDQLPVGMSGDLILSGEGFDYILDKSYLSNE